MTYYNLSIIVHIIYNHHMYDLLKMFVDIRFIVSIRCPIGIPIRGLLFYLFLHLALSLSLFHLSSLIVTLHTVTRVHTALQKML